MTKKLDDTPKITKDVEVTLDELANLTNLSKTWLNKLANDGFFKSERRGFYRLGNVINGLMKFYKDDRRASSQTAAMHKVHEARAKQIEQQTARQARELISFELHGEIVDMIVGSIVAFCNGLPSMLTRDPTLRAEYIAKIDKERHRLSAYWAKLAKADGNAVDPFQSADDDDEVAQPEPQP